MSENKFYVGQKLKNSPHGNEPTFEIVKIFYTMVDETLQYRVKNLSTGKLQVTTEEFLYLCN